MRIRGLVLALALLLALGATSAVFLYVQGVRQEAEKSPSGDLVAVIVAKEDIPGGTLLDPLIERGTFDSMRVPRDALVQGVVTDLSQLQGRTTIATIIQGEQITAARLQGSETQVSSVGLQPGFQAVSISLEMPQGGGGFLQPGDHVNVFATLSNVNLIRLDSLNSLLRASANTQTRKLNIGDFTVSVVPDVRVLKASAPPESAEGRSSNRVGIQVLLELKPEDAQKVIFANEKGSVWLALMYPGDEGVSPTPVNAVDILTRA